jgi:hypothetical protein
MRRVSNLQKVLMWFDDILLINGWNNGNSSLPSGSTFISTSGLHDIQIIYSNEESISSYGISLFWSCASPSHPIDFQLIPSFSMYTRDDLSMPGLTSVANSFQYWQQSANPQPKVSGHALSIATAGTFVSFKIAFPDTLAESYSMRYDPYSTLASSAGRLPGVLSVAMGTTAVYFTEPQTISGNTALYTFPGEASIGTISSGVSNSYSADLVAVAAKTYIQTPFSSNADVKYVLSAKLNGQACSSSLDLSDSDSNRVTKLLQWHSPAVYELVAPYTFSSSCSTGAFVFPDNSNGAIINYPTGCNAFNGMFDVRVQNDKSVDVVPHKPYGYISVVSGSLSATFYSTSWHLNSHQTLFHKQSGSFIGTLSSGLPNSAGVRQGTLLHPSPITLVFSEFISGEGVGNGYKVNNTVLITKSSIGAAGPSLLVTVTSVTANGAIRTVSVKSPTYRIGGTYFACRVTVSGHYKLIIANNKADFVAPFSVYVYPNFPCASTSILAFPAVSAQITAIDLTSFSVHLRDSFGNLVLKHSCPLGKQ